VFEPLLNLSKALGWGTLTSSIFELVTSAADAAVDSASVLVLVCIGGGAY
jgi:hypothetical protein